MSHIRMVIRKGSMFISAVIIGVMLPLGTLFADPSACTPPTSGSGVHAPNGADSGTFTYQCDGPNAGNWTNAYYAYDPSTGSRTPLYSPDYKYDCATGIWHMTQWDFSPANGQFYQSQVVTSAPSGVATGCDPAPSVAASSSNPSGTDPTTTASGNDPSSSTSNTGPGSTNNTDLTGNNNLNLNNANTLGVTNTLTANAASGNALVLGNTTAGDAATGNTQDMANVVNLLQSSTNALGAGSNVVTFTANINGNVNGDLLFDPATIGTIQNAGPNSTNTGNTALNNNITVNNSTGAAINNNLNLAANSGNAAVNGNTSGGNASSGSADTIANVVNMINSAVTAGKSFVGTVNINGNLNGDILLPPKFIDQLLAANVPTVNLTGPNSTNSTNTSTSNNISATNTNNLGINNAVDASANTGAASVSGNTNGGSATSGAANTKITAFNLTGSKVIGANDLLVFVNVTGKWVGLIVNAPPGATAAELGGGISSTGPNSTNTSNTNVNNNAALNNTTNEQINNNIKTAAKSGSADVSNNTKGGNASSGNADNAINLLNVENSTLDLSNWFGILFINVFGTWNGSFGVNTAAGDPVAAPSGSSGAASPLLAFRFVAPSNGGSSGSNGSNNSFSNFNSAFIPGSGGNTIPGSSSTASAVLAAATSRNNKSPQQVTQTQGHINWGLALSGSGALLIYVLGEQFYNMRRSRS